jgi:methyl-accepting chemotaxis protein
VVRKQVKTGAIAAVLSLVVVATVSGIGMNAIRVGGALHERQLLSNEFVADIMPPPQYVIEPMLEVTRLMRDPSLLAEKRESLARLEKVYRERESYWKPARLTRTCVRSWSTQRRARPTSSGGTSTMASCLPWNAAMPLRQKPPTLRRPRPSRSIAGPSKA